MLKKLVYQEHMLAQQELQEQLESQEYGNVEMPDTEALQRQMQSNPQAAMKQAQQMGNLGGGMGKRTSKHDIHPHLARYNTIVHVVGEDEDES